MARNMRPERGYRPGPMQRYQLHTKVASYSKCIVKSRSNYRYTSISPSITDTKDDIGFVIYEDVLQQKMEASSRTISDLATFGHGIPSAATSERLAAHIYHDSLIAARTRAYCLPAQP
jgi:hypothetical protein